MRCNRTSATACQYFDFYRVVWQLSIVNLDMQTRGGHHEIRHKTPRFEKSGLFFFGNTELSLELWMMISGISGFDD